MKKLYFLCLAICIFGLLAACSEGEETKEVAKAEDEGISGDLQFYTSQPDEDAQKLIDAFNEKYPEVKVNVFRSGTEEVINKINAENKAGEVQADVLLVADAVTFEKLKEEDLLLKYKSEEAKAIDEGFVDSDEMYSGTKIMATALVVNKDKVTDLPTSWKALESEEAKGQVTMPSPLYSGAAAYNLGVFTRDNDFGWEFYNKLKENEAIAIKGNGAVLEAVASGEKSYGVIVDFLVARAVKEGSPVELIYPKEGVPVITEPIGILKNTKNEKAAKVFVDFVLSLEGQKIAAEIGYTPIREDVEAPEGLKSISEFKVLEAPIKELLKDRESDKQKFNELFGE